MILLHYLFVLLLRFSGQVQTFSHWHHFRRSLVNRNLCVSHNSITSNDFSIRFLLAHQLIMEEKEETPACSLTAKGLCSTSKNKNTPQLAVLQHANQEYRFTYAHMCEEVDYQGNKSLLRCSDLNDSLIIYCFKFQISKNILLDNLIALCPKTDSGLSTLFVPLFVYFAQKPTLQL